MVAVNLSCPQTTDDSSLSFSLSLSDSLSLLLSRTLALSHSRSLALSQSRNLVLRVNDSSLAKMRVRWQMTLLDDAK